MQISHFEHNFDQNESILCLICMKLTNSCFQCKIFSKTIFSISRLLNFLEEPGPFFFIFFKVIAILVP